MKYPLIKYPLTLWLGVILGVLLVCLVDLELPSAYDSEHALQVKELCAQADACASSINASINAFNCINTNDFVGADYWLERSRYWDKKEHEAYENR